MKRAMPLLVVTLAFVGCEEKQKSRENLGHDQEIMKAASAAANEVIRNATDCGAAKPLVPEAYRAIEAARTTAKAATSQTILNTLKEQVDRIAQLCP
jgi:hypothetical protein